MPACTTRTPRGPSLTGRLHCTHGRRAAHHHGVRTFTPQEDADLLHRLVDDTARLTVRRGDRRRVVARVREHERATVTTTDALPARTAHLAIHTLYRSLNDISDRIAQAMDNVQGEGVTHLTLDILDLRGNAGGLPSAAVTVADLLLLCSGGLVSLKPERGNPGAGPQRSARTSLVALLGQPRYDQRRGDQRQRPATRWRAHDRRADQRAKGDQPFGTAGHGRDRVPAALYPDPGRDDGRCRRDARYPGER